MSNKIAVIKLNKDTVSWYDPINNIYLSEFKDKKADVYDDMSFESIRNGIKYKCIKVIEGEIPDEECNIEHDLTSFYNKKEIDDKVSSFNEQFITKANKDEIWSMANMGQDIKENMTGGSVAVVGVHSILDENIIDRQINANKLSFLSQKHINLFNKDDVNNQINTTLNSVGEVVSGANTTTSGFIYVTKGMKFYYDNVHFIGEYDLDETFIKRSDYNAIRKGEILLTENTRYVKLVVNTSKISNTYFSQTDEFIEFGKVHDINYSQNGNGEIFKKLIENSSYNVVKKNLDYVLFDDRNIYTTLNSKDGYTINGSTGNETVNQDYFVTDFIEVEQYTTYDCDFSNYSTVALYNKNKNFIERKAWDIKEFETGESCYIRVTGRLQYKNDYHITKQMNYSEYFKNEIKNIVNKKTNDNRPVITFIDDDADKLFLTKVKPILNNANIKCGIGVITDKVDTSNYMTLDELKQLKQEGHVICSHSSNHSSTLYKKDSYELLDNLDSVYEEDMNKSLNYLQKNELDTDIFVYPYGWFSDNKYEKIMIRNSSKYYKYAVDNGTKYETTNDINPHMIKRIFIRDEKGLEYYKSLIDEAKNNPSSLLVFGTHSGLSELTSEFLQQVVDYVTTSGITILNPHDAFEEKIAE